MAKKQNTQVTDDVILEDENTTEDSRESRASTKRAGAFKIPQAKVDESKRKRISEAKTRLRLDIPKEVVQAHKEAGYHIAWCRFRLNGNVDVNNLRELLHTKGYEFVPPQKEQVGALAELSQKSDDGQDIIVQGDSVLMRCPLEYYITAQKSSASASRKETYDLESVSNKKLSKETITPFGSSKIHRGSGGDIGSNTYKPSSSFVDNDNSE